MNKSPVRRRKSPKTRHGKPVAAPIDTTVMVRPDPGDISKDYRMPEVEARKLADQGKLKLMGGAVDGVWYAATATYPKGD